jgi:hypothetical protein
MKRLVTSSKFTPGCDAVIVRELTGKDEDLVTEVDSASAMRLVSAVASDESGNPIDAACLATADRHRVLAAVYQLTFGNRVESTVVCETCEERFDLVFELPDLVGSTHEEPSVPSSVDDTGFDLGGGLHVRAPTGEDELSATGMSAGDAATQLLSRCVVSGEVAGRDAEVRSRLETLAPLLDVDLEPECPECGAKQKRRFDIQSYLLLAIGQGRDHMTDDVHLIASTYHWPLQDILALARTHRRELVERIIAERSSGIA